MTFNDFRQKLGIISENKLFQRCKYSKMSKRSLKVKYKKNLQLIFEQKSTPS
jgi:hypothetical protein